MSRQILWHYFPIPVPYTPALQLQQKIHELQLHRRRSYLGTSQNILLLLQHRPVYTAGRRQLVDELAHERRRLQRLGAEWISTSRGGETTFHGPGQLVGYPLLDLGALSMSVRDYVCVLEKLMKGIAKAHGVPIHTSEHTGVFVGPDAKLGSIGVQVRHRLTSHGFAMNVTQEPLAWFNEVVSCGLADVHAVSLAGENGKAENIDSLIPEVLTGFGGHFGSELVPVAQADTEVFSMIAELERLSEASGFWPLYPVKQ